MIFPRKKLRSAINFLGNIIAAIVFPSDQIFCNTGTIVISKSAEDKKSIAQPLPLIRGNGNFGRQCEGRVTMVGSSACNMEWQNNPILNPRPCSGNGRIPSGLGCSFRRSTYSGSMVREGTHTAHQLLGVDGRCTGSENICKAQKEYPCATTNGQQNGNLLCKPHGGNPSPEPGAASLSSMAVVPPERDNSFSRVSPRGKQWDSRQGIMNHAILSRMDAECPSVHVHNAGDGSMPD